MIRVGMTLADQVTRLRHRRRVWAWTGWGSLAGWIVLSLLINAVYPGPAAAVLALAWLIVSALAVVALSIAAVDTIRLHRQVKAARDAGPVASDPALAQVQVGGRSPGGSAWSGIVWPMETVRMVFMLLFIIYAVIVQAEAIAYLAGSRNVDYVGISPPVPINGDGSAFADIFIALFWEIIFGLIFLLAGLFFHAWVQDRRQQRGW